VGEPAEGARLEVASTLPLPSDLPDPVALRDADPDLIAEFPPEAPRDPLLGDLAGASEEVRDQLNEQIDGWTILETANKFTGETQAAVQEHLGPAHANLFESPTEY